jgi:hypothetical protein
MLPCVNKREYILTLSIVAEGEKMLRQRTVSCHPENGHCLCDK